MSQAVGFIGLGAMGWPMASHLVAGGCDLTVLDAKPGVAERFAGEIGGALAHTPRAVAERADVIITMLPTSQIVGEVLNGENGALAALRPGALILEMSSGVPTATRELAKAVGAGGGVLVDAPVSGGVARARTAELAIMAGGPPEALDRAEPILKLMGSSILRTGAVGTAHAMKALNNLVSAAGFTIAVEALVIGKTAGLDPAVMVDVLNASTGMNNATQKKLKQFVLSHSFDSGFGLGLMVKDLGIALGLAEDAGLQTPLAELTRDLWSLALADKVGDDHTAQALYVEALAGVDL